MKDIARQKALKILDIVDQSQRPLDAVLEEILPEGNLHDKRDRAFIQTLVYGVLRWRGRIDWVIAHFSNVKIERIDPNVLNILRMGLFQIMFLDRVPVSAAVNTSVELAKSVAQPYVVKFVNAVLRKAGSGHTDVPFPDPEKNPAAAMAARQSFPRWLVDRWFERYGEQECRRLCTFINTIPPITVRVNTLKTDRDQLNQALDKDTESAIPTRSSPVGISFSNPKIPIAKMSAYQKGWFQVQDEAAQLVTMLLSPEPNQRVMDACAGLGGKTGHIAQLMDNKGKVIAADKDRRKLGRLRSEMMHLGISVVTTRILDLDLPFEEAGAPPTFDRILLDAPCSGLGVLRRNPDAKWAPAKRDLAFFMNRQAAFLTHVAPLLKVGGTILYTVCSVEPEENEAVVAAFLEKHSGYAVDRETRTIPEAVRPFVDRQGFFRSLPHKHNMDGFFAARLRRIK